MVPKNVLWFIFDDLRVEHNVTYGRRHVHSPAMDRLSSSGVVFERAYAQMALCGPSRASFMTGRRPATTRVYNHFNHFREEGAGPSWVSLPQHFKQHGYLTLGGGKTYHPGKPPDYDAPRSWSPDRPYFPHEGGNECSEGGARVGRVIPVPPYHHAEMICTVANASALVDARLASEAIRWLQLAQTNRSRPFFFAVGLHRPHMPWVVPADVFGRYTRTDVGLPRHPSLPAKVHPIAWNAVMKVFGDVLNGTAVGQELSPSPSARALPWGAPCDDGRLCDQHRTREARRGYYAAVTFADAQMGRVLDALDDAGYSESTLIVACGDHGFHLGEKGNWAKQTLWEEGVRVPLVIRAPWLDTAAGARIAPPVELIDLYKSARTPHHAQDASPATLTAHTDPHRTHACALRGSNFRARGPAAARGGRGGSLTRPAARRPGGRHLGR